MNSEKMRYSRILLAAMAAISGCVLNEPLTQNDSIAAIGCEDCGSNTAIFFGFSLHELALNKKPNEQGIRLLGALDHLGHPVELVVENDVLLGKAAKATIAQPLEVHAKLIVSVPTKKGHKVVEIEITEIAATNYWVDNFSYDRVSYRMSYDWSSDKGTIKEEICPEFVEQFDLPEELTPSNPIRLPDYHFVVFVGDRYDFKTKTIAVKEKAAGWLNIACDGSATFKLHSTRHTQASSDATHHTTRAERQALLNMYFANYCGDSTVNTVTGHPLHYAVDSGWFDNFYGGGPFLDGVDTVEAIWDENGAVCLKEPRLADVAYEDVKCGGQLIPVCTQRMIARWQDHGHVLSGNPPL